MEHRTHPTDYEEGRPPKRHYKERKLFRLLRKPALLMLLLIVVFLIILAFVNSSKNNRLQEAREQATQEREALVSRANQRVTDNTVYLLKTLMMPFAWSVRTALLSGNVQQVDQYLYQFVQEPNFELILVADPRGKIISTTNQKYRGGAFADYFEENLLRTDNTTVDTSDPATIRVITPIMGLNSRLGTLYVIYKPQDPLAAKENQ